MARPDKPLISRAAAVQAALEIIDAGGLESFSLLRLAAHMGVRAPSLYHHFQSKNEILMGVARYVAGTAVASSDLTPGPDWPDHFVMLASNFRLSLLRYRNVAPLLLLYPPRDLLLDGYEDAVAFLRESGVPELLHIRIVEGMETLAVGAALSESRKSATDGAACFGGADPVHEPILFAAVQACRLGPAELFEAKVRGFLRGVVPSETSDAARTLG